METNRVREVRVDETLSKYDDIDFGTHQYHIDLRHSHRGDPDIRSPNHLGRLTRDAHD